MLHESLRVLLIEDDAGDALLIEELLHEKSRSAFRVEREPRLQAGLERLRREQFDITLLDLGLPDSSGLATLERFMQAGPGPAVIVLTGQEDEELGLQALQRGAQDFLTKTDLEPKILSRALQYAVERHRAELALINADEEWQQTFDTIPDLVALIDDHHRIIKANRAMASAVSAGAEDLVGRLCYHVMHGTDRPPSQCPHTLVMQDGQGHAGEMYMPNLGGTFFVSATPLGDRHGNAHRCVHVARDISAFKEMEESLNQRVEELRNATAETRALLEGSQALLTHRKFEQSARAIFQVCARHLNARAGYVALLNEHEQENELLFLEAGGLPCSVDPSLPMPVRGLRAQAYRSGQVVWDNDFMNSQWAQYMPEGHAPLDNVLFAPMLINGKAAGVIGLANKPGGFDENDARLARAFAEFAAIGLMNSRNLDALERSENRFRAIFDDAAVGIDLIDREGHFLQVNAAFMKMLGYTEEELLEKTVFDITHPHDLDESTEYLGKLAEGKLDTYQHEKRYIRKDGRTIWVELSVSALRDSQAAHWATIGVIRDVTTQKEYSEALLRLATAVDQAAEAIEITDKDGVIVYVNPAFEAITGYSREEAVGKKPSILKSGLQTHNFYADLWETITSGRIWRGRLVNKRKDGDLYHEDATISPIIGPEGEIRHYVAVKRDVTRELSLQKQLLKAQKMESIATMAGGIAHDFNNLLTIASGYTELLLLDKAADSPGYEELQTVLHAAQRGADLVKRILTFSKKVETNPRTIDLNEEVRLARKLLFRTVPKMIEIELRLAEDVEKVRVDPGQLEQAILNLAVNAQHAMPDGGKLVLETSNVTIHQESVREDFTVKPGRYVMLSITDTGHGIPRHVIDRIFEPFFTTKGREEGTGLGLAMVYGIVTGHGGHITCESELGSGTTFRLVFPAVVESEQANVADSDQMEAFGVETVLIVDDEASISDLARRILTQSGYSCLTAASGEEAIKRYQERGDEISIVLLDLLMPGMGGVKCLEALQGIDPSVKILITSGYSSDPATRRKLQGAARGFVTKPYRSKDLLSAVRKALDE
jgi:PAS domain S-box-containing protein